MISFRRSKGNIYKKETFEDGGIIEHVVPEISLEFNYTRPIITNINSDIKVTYFTFDLEQGKHIIDTSINKEAEFKIEVDGSTVIDTPLTIVNGEATITLNTPNAGKYILFVDKYRCEVNVDES